jgi:hypothetical protein
MTKRIIDADALLDWVDGKMHEYINVWGETWEYSVSCLKLKQKINELATPAPAPAPQESNKSPEMNVNALLKSLGDYVYKCQCKSQVVVNWNYTANKIREIANLAAPQESIFDADGWRTDFENIPEYNDILMFVGADEPRPYFIEENDTMIVYGGTSKVNGVIKSNEQFFGKILKWKLVNKPTIPICKYFA